MNDASLIFTPTHFWQTSHLPEHNVNTLYGFNALVFLYAVADGAPRIVSCELDLNAEFSDCDIRKCLRMWCHVNFKKQTISRVSSH